MKEYKVYLDKAEAEYIELCKKRLRTTNSGALRAIIGLTISEYKPEFLVTKDSPFAKEIIAQFLKLGNNLNQLTHSFNVLMNANIFTQEELRANKRGLETIENLNTEIVAFLDDLKKRLL